MQFLKEYLENKLIMQAQLKRISISTKLLLHVSIYLLVLYFFCPYNSNVLSTESMYVLPIVIQADTAS